MKTNRIIYYIITGLLSLMMIGSAAMYFFNYEEISATYVLLGFPTYLVYPVAIAKLLGVTAILTRIHPSLVEWAYAGFFFEFLLAISSHVNAGDGEAGAAIAALVLLIASYFFYQRTFIRAITV